MTPLPSDAAPRTDVAVVIISFHSQADIVHCLAALEQSTWNRFRVVVCENGGEEAFQKLRAALPAQLKTGQAIELLSAPGNPGYAGGINLAIERTQPAGAYWILNPDTQPDPGALEANPVPEPTNFNGSADHYPKRKTAGPMARLLSFSESEP